MRNKAAILCLAALALGSCSATGGDQPHGFATGKDFTEWRASDQVHYVMGLADAFTYLSAKTGHQQGLSACYRKYNVSEPSLSADFYSHIEVIRAYDRNYLGPDPKTLPAVEVFDHLSSLYCKDER